jgi:hypothetical protein
MSCVEVWAICETEGEHTATVPRPSKSTRTLSTLSPRFCSALSLPPPRVDPPLGTDPQSAHARSRISLAESTSNGLSRVSSSSKIASKAGRSSNRSSGRSDATEHQRRYLFQIDITHVLGFISTMFLQTHAHFSAGIMDSHTMTPRVPIRLPRPPATDRFRNKPAPGHRPSCVKVTKSESRRCRPDGRAACSIPSAEIPEEPGCHRCTICGALPRTWKTRTAGLEVGGCLALDIVKVGQEQR